ncbi:hypothetical protein [Silvimonas sp.]|uniref:hypothetical protein n=1 Tax=Silvimonas sp. TaxID=2650811 RepID=UPI00283EE2E0|nr:hypothetical protein [Silvimonas sp.]MDR3427786.1 hypothetical protein [Silvimonas sp.]
MIVVNSQEHLDAFNAAVEDKQDDIRDACLKLEDVFKDQSNAVAIAAMAIAFANIVDDLEHLLGGFAVFSNISTNTFKEILQRRTAN